MTAKGKGIQNREAAEIYEYTCTFPYTKILTHSLGIEIVLNSICCVTLALIILQNI